MSVKQGPEVPVECFQAILAGSLGLVIVWKMSSKFKKHKHRREWDLGKDVVMLHQFVRGKDCPNLSPYALKVECFLRLANIKYEVESKNPFGPRHKCPWITINGEDIGDSEFIIDNLSQHFNINLNSSLDSRRAAYLEAIRVLVDEHLFWCIVTWRYWIDGCHSFMKTQDLGGFMNFLFPKFMPRGMKSRSKQHGIGLFTHDQIYQICRKDCGTLSDALGEDDFFGGTEPCRTDCSVFGHLAQLMWNAPDTRYHEIITYVYPNLSRYCLRMKERIYPDWSECLLPRKES